MASLKRERHFHNNNNNNSVAILAQVAEKNRQVILAAWVVSGCLFGSGTKASVLNLLAFVCLIRDGVYRLPRVEIRRGRAPRPRFSWCLWLMFVFWPRCLPQLPVVAAFVLGFLLSAFVFAVAATGFAQWPGPLWVWPSPCAALVRLRARCVACRPLLRLVSGCRSWCALHEEQTKPLHSSTVEKSERPEQNRDLRCQSGPSAKDSVIFSGGDSPKNYGADQQRLQISDLHFNKFPTRATFACWKIRFKTEVCICSQFPTEAMHWIKEVEMVESVDDLKSSSSVRGIRMPDFEILDARIASALNKIIHNSHFKRRISLEEQKAQKRDRFLRGRQIAYLIYDYWSSK